MKAVFFSETRSLCALSGLFLPPSPACAAVGLPLVRTPANTPATNHGVGDHHGRETVSPRGMRVLFLALFSFLFFTCLGPEVSLYSAPPPH